MHKAFEESTDIKVTAAQIGIFKDKWDFSDDTWMEDQAREFM